MFKGSQMSGQGVCGKQHSKTIFLLAGLIFWLEWLESVTSIQFCFVIFIGRQNWWNLSIVFLNFSRNCFQTEETKLNG